MQPTAHPQATSLNEVTRPVLYLEQLTDTKYGNPCRPKLKPPPAQIKIFTLENNQLHHTNVHCFHWLHNELSKKDLSYLSEGRKSLKLLCLNLSKRLSLSLMYTDIIVCNNYMNRYFY